MLCHNHGFVDLLYECTHCTQTERRECVGSMHLLQLMIAQTHTAGTRAYKWLTYLPGKAANDGWKSIIMGIRYVSLLTLISHNFSNSWVMYK